MKRLLALLPLFTLAPLHAQDWYGNASVHNQQVPVHLHLSTPTADGHITGAFLNGAEKQASTSGELKDGHLVLHFDYFARTLEGDIKDNTLTATYGGARGGSVPLTLQQNARPAALNATQVRPIVGDWEVAVQSPKGESAWTLRISPARATVPAKAVILRIDGDTGGLYGGYDVASKQYLFSHFSAAGPALFSIAKGNNNTLTLTNLLHDGQQWTARRPAEARKENLSAPTKATQQTSVNDKGKPFTFGGTSLDGKSVTNQDPRFAGKVVIVAIGGSWCPNCHDEAPFLEEFYKRYHARGLEVVELSFEEEAQLKNPARLRAFQQKYGITYPILLGGTPEQVQAKLPDAKNLNCWPTAFFLGRDGRVKEVHAGFSGPATGKAYTDLKSETDALLQKLLNTPATRTAKRNTGL